MLERSRQLVSSTLLFIYQTNKISHQSGRVHSSTHHPSTSRFNINQSTMTTLLLIDVQKDFHPGGSLAIPTASSDAQRTAQFIRQNASSIHRIVATMDSHQKLHIAHPCFWKNDKGEHPNPFTVISNEDVVTGKWIPRGDLTFPVVPHGVMMDDAGSCTARLDRWISCSGVLNTRNGSSRREGFNYASDQSIVSLVRRGTKEMLYFVQRPSKYSILAASHDRLGWVNFLERRISRL